MSVLAFSRKPGTLLSYFQQRQEPTDRGSLSTVSPRCMSPRLVLHTVFTAAILSQKSLSTEEGTVEYIRYHIIPGPASTAYNSTEQESATPEEDVFRTVSSRAVRNHVA